MKNAYKNDPLKDSSVSLFSVKLSAILLSAMTLPFKVSPLSSILTFLWRSSGMRNPRCSLSWWSAILQDLSICLEPSWLMGEVDLKLPGGAGPASGFFRSLMSLKRKGRNCVCEGGRSQLLPGLYSEHLHIRGGVTIIVKHFF